MDIKLLARIGAIAFVAIVIVISVIQMRETPKTGQLIELPPAVQAPGADPLVDELVHCQSIGQAGATDPQCLSAWAENRRRFLGLGAGPRPSLPAVAAATSAGGR